MTAGSRGAHSVERTLAAAASHVRCSCPNAGSGRRADHSANPLSAPRPPLVARVAEPELHHSHYWISTRVGRSVIRRWLRIGGWDGSKVAVVAASEGGISIADAEVLSMG
jgi:hypothetical protein